jgi:hypothetical protein
MITVSRDHVTDNRPARSIRRLPSIELYVHLQYVPVNRVTTDHLCAELYTEYKFGFKKKKCHSYSMAIIALHTTTQIPASVFSSESHVYITVYYVLYMFIPFFLAFGIPMTFCSLGVTYKFQIHLSALWVQNPTQHFTYKIDILRMPDCDPLIKILNCTYYKL